jgi:hypothetical protein
MPRQQGDTDECLNRITRRSGQLSRLSVLLGPLGPVIAGFVLLNRLLLLPLVGSKYPKPVLLAIFGNMIGTKKVQYSKKS